MRTIALRYLDGFQCIGADCEDDCCSGWAVPVDESHYRAIEARLSETEEGKAELGRSITVGDNPNKHRYALMVLDDQRHCAMLGEDRLCKLHGRFGEEVLPDTCALFPRHAVAVGVAPSGRFELSASLSCPEIARRCLLVDGSTDEIDIDKEKIVRGLLVRTVRGDEGLYQASFEAVRGLVLALLGQRRVPVASRLCAVAWFAEQTRAFLHDQAQEADRGLLMRLFQILRQPETLDQFHQQVASQPMNEPFPASVVHEVMLSALEDPAPLLAELVQRALERDSEDPEQLLAAHRERTAALPAAAVETLELALEAFCRNYAFKDWFLRTPSFVRWVQGLLVRVAIVRYLFAAHPLVESDPGAAIVEVVYSLSRTFEHGDRSLADILDGLSDQGMLTLGHAVALITF